jgi:hypothetical protein
MYRELWTNLYIVVGMFRLGIVVSLLGQVAYYTKVAIGPKWTPMIHISECVYRVKP